MKILTLGMLNVTKLKILLLFVHIFFLVTEKKGKTRIFVRKWLDHVLLMTSYLVAIATASHQTFAKMCLRNMHTATENGRW